MTEFVPATPLLLYDGECAFCAYWVRYWQRLTGAAVDYRPYQEMRTIVPDLDQDACRRAVQMYLPNGAHYAGAAASVQVLAYGGHGRYLACYRRSALFARGAEWAYSAVAGRRRLAFVVSRLLWGSERHPARYAQAAQMFQRLLALIYVAAFASLATQIAGLVGSSGILPATALLDTAARAHRAPAWIELPTVFWFAVSDTALRGACVAGALAAALAACGYRRTPLLALCYVLYLSLFSVGQDFMSFQWDLLLLEAGFLALWLPAHPTLLPWLFRLLLFRFMFSSGCVKLLSGDPNWANLHALDFYYETQPLPTPLAWYVHQLPAWFDQICVAATFIVELILPFLIFTPRRPRQLAAAGFIVLESVILLTGNYNFFNLLTMALVLFLFDDGQWRRQRWPMVVPGRLARNAASALAAVVVLHNLLYLVRPFAPQALPSALSRLVATLAPLHIVNGYGLFAVMTTTRPEIEIQGSVDGEHWRNYVFAFKPGDPTHGPRWNIPQQPRLDWQMWFAALASADDVPWFGHLLERLLHNTPAVVALFADNPFAAQAPRFVRALLWQYRFSTAGERAAAGQIWQRRLLGLYYPAVHLP